MASNFSLQTLAVLAVALALSSQGTLGGLTCEDLPTDRCAYAVSKSGKRCVLEMEVTSNGEEYICRTSEYETSSLKNQIETDQCIKACGLNRTTLGISSDSLLDSQFTKKLCSPQCYGNCPNTVDLYFNLAAGEDVYLPKLCEAQGANIRKGRDKIRSSGFVVPPGPVHPVKYMEAPAMPPY